jgi:hypothetical protein
MLLEKCEKLRTLVEDKINNRDLSNRAETIQNMTRRFEGAVDPIRKSTDIAIFLRENNIIDRNSFDQIISKAESINKIIDALPEIKKEPWSYQSEEEFFSFYESVKSLKNEIESTVNNKWAEFIKGKGLDESKLDQLNIFENIDSYKTSVKQIKELVKKLDDKKFKCSGKKSDLDEISKLAAEIENKYSDIGISKLDSKIEEFLRKTATYEGAPLEYLTKEVIEWLKKNNVYNLYMVKPKKTIGSYGRI